MPDIQKRTVSLPSEHAAFIDQLVAKGEYASVSEVVRAGLRALRERDEVVERWLNEQVASAYDRLRDDPKRTLSAKSVFDDVRAHHGEMLKGNS